jgi:hypothetical protein
MLVLGDGQQLPSGGVFVPGAPLGGDPGQAAGSRAVPGGPAQLPGIIIGPDGKLPPGRFIPAQRPHTVVNASVLSDEEAAERGATLATASIFYAQNRVLADFLLEASGDKQIIARISEGLARGMTMDEWLSREGRAHRLPASVASLHAAWEAWAAETYGPPAAGSGAPGREPAS